VVPPPAAHFGTELGGVPFIGDKATDVEAARAVGARPILVGANAPSASAVLERRLGPVEQYADLAAAAAALIAEGSRRA
jgi:D-glycero-D-manno-heptose 1,7-bisphosphate phosphatase